MTSGERASVVPLRRQRRCPICRRPADPATHPFCSQRCADLDLAKWLGGDYRVETDEIPGGEPGGDDKP